jgi:hypothetical protein
MPAITASLSEVGYEGYVSIPKGMRSKVIDTMLRDYALKRTHVLTSFEKMSVQDVLDRQKFMQISMETFQDEIKTLKEENKKLRGEEE